MKQTALVMAVLLSGSIAMAQKSFTELVNLKKLDKIISLDVPAGKVGKDGMGIVPDLAKRPVKKVALVSFYLDDLGKSEGKFIGLTEDGGNKIATEFYNESLGDIKSSFQKNGIEVMIIESVLNSAEKKEGYENFELSMTKVMHAMVSYAERWKYEGIPMATAPAGYRMLPTTIVPADYGVSKSMGELTDLLEVDAVLVAVVQTRTSTKSTTFIKTGLSMHGPNPTPKTPGKKYPGKSYNTGMHYGSVMVKVEKEFEFILRKKGNVISQDYTGYGEVMGKISSKLAEHIALQSAGN
ncbi:MAG: hypothetical protein JXQ90_06150 [Cyclobacteriaceae bacterium]